MTDRERARRAARRRRFYLRRALFFGTVLTLLLASAVLLFSRCGSAPEPDRPRDPETAPPPASPTGTEAGPAPAETLPEGWKWIEMPEGALSEGTLALVNAAHSYDPSLPRTVSVYENKTGAYLVKDIYLSVTPETIRALNAWMDAFAAETGVTDVNIVAGWRSYADQVCIYDNAVETKGQAHADAYIALPGCSEHHTGLAVDLDTYDVEAGTSGGFDGTGPYAWAVAHAWEYGFIQRYPPAKSRVTGIDYEAWHFRYVGLPHAYVMAEKDLCLEEYIDYLRGFPATGQHLTVTCGGAEYEICWCPGSTVAVPSSGDYTASGNNVDGFIVTIQK